MDAPAVLHLVEPDDATLAAALSASVGEPFTYPEAGATAGELPPATDREVRQRVVGRGADAWRRATEALRGWRQFDLGWVRLARHDTPLAPGELVAFASRQLGVWAISVGRIVYVVDEERRLGFAFGTLGGHVLAGEEQFLLAWDPATDAVVFRIRKFSRPRHPLVRLAAPIARAVQRRFTADALAAMARAVEGA